MPLAQVHGAVIAGMSGTVVTVEVDVSAGLPAVGLVGLADAAIGEARQRARCAVENTGLKWPMGRVTIGLSPAHVRKHGTGLDLPIAIGVLAACGQLEHLPGDLGSWVIVGELGLDGRVRPIPGAITIACAIQQAGFTSLVLPAEHVAECSRVPGVEIIGVESVQQAVQVLLGKDNGQRVNAPRTRQPMRHEPDLADVLGQEEGRRCLEIAAAGRHSLAMVGPPGVGKTLLAERITGLLPNLDEAAAVDVMAVHALVSDGGFVTGEDLRPPFQAPHHSTSPAALLGSVHGGSVRPGAVSLAHRGVLFLDEAPEFPRNTLEALRQPLESSVVSLHRASWSGEVPADFQLIVAANPCPCGFYGSQGSLGTSAPVCRCPQTTRQNYAARISGPLLDRIDLRVQLHPVRARSRGESSADVAERVAQARARALRRWSSVNARAANPVVASHALEPAAQEILDAHLRRSGGLRSTHRITKVAWTLSDLAGRERPSIQDVLEAIEWHQPLWEAA